MNEGITKQIMKSKVLKRRLIGDPIIAMAQKEYNPFTGQSYISIDEGFQRPAAWLLGFLKDNRYWWRHEDRPRRIIILVLDGEE